MKIMHWTEIPKKPIEMEGAKDVDIRWLISQEDNAKNFFMRMFELQKGGYTPLHTHPHEHEVYILEGEGTLLYEKKEYKFKQGYVIFIEGGKEHQFKNTGEGSLKFLCIVPK